MSQPIATSSLRPPAADCDQAARSGLPSVRARPSSGTAFSGGPDAAASATEHPYLVSVGVAVSLLAIWQGGSRCR